jgi:hypothetical protein
MFGTKNCNKTPPKVTAAPIVLNGHRLAADPWEALDEIHGHV